jgi:hypothetical protein
LEDAIATLVEYILMAEHLPSGREVSLPVPSPTGGLAWTEWSHVWGREMALQRALEKLNLEYPADSD